MLFVFFDQFRAFICHVNFELTLRKFFKRNGTVVIFNIIIIMLFQPVYDLPDVPDAAYIVVYRIGKVGIFFDDAVKGAQAYSAVVLDFFFCFFDQASDALDISESISNGVRSGLSRLVDLFLAFFYFITVFFLFGLKLSEFPDRLVV